MELKFSLELEIRPIRGTGTILYSQEREDGLGDYLALVMVDGVLEFRYNLGGGPVTIRSVQPLTLGEWHRIVAKRYSFKILNNLMVCRFYITIQTSGHIIVQKKLVLLFWSHLCLLGIVRIFIIYLRRFEKNF